MKPVFDSLGRSRLGLVGQEADVRDHLYRRDLRRGLVLVMAGVFGLAPKFKESPEDKSGLSTHGIGGPK